MQGTTPAPEDPFFLSSEEPPKQKQNRSLRQPVDPHIPQGFRKDALCLLLDEVRAGSSRTDSKTDKLKKRNYIMEHILRANRIRWRPGKGEVEEDYFDQCHRE